MEWGFSSASQISAFIADNLTSLSILTAAVIYLLKKSKPLSTENDSKPETSKAIPGNGPNPKPMYGPDELARQYFHGSYQRKTLLKKI